MLQGGLVDILINRICAYYDAADRKTATINGNAPLRSKREKSITTAY